MVLVIASALEDDVLAVQMWRSVDIIIFWTVSKVLDRQTNNSVDDPCLRFKCYKELRA